MANIAHVEVTHVDDETIKATVVDADGTVATAESKTWDILGWPMNTATEEEAIQRAIYKL